MTHFTTEIMEILINKGDLDDLFRRHLEIAINSLLQAELTTFLDYEKYDFSARGTTSGTTNSEKTKKEHQEH